MAGGVRMRWFGARRERREEDGDNARILFRDFGTDTVTDNPPTKQGYVNRKALKVIASKT